MHDSKHDEDSIQGRAARKKAQTSSGKEKSEALHRRTGCQGRESRSDWKERLCSLPAPRRSGRTSGDCECCGNFWSALLQAAARQQAACLTCGKRPSVFIVHLSRSFISPGTRVYFGTYMTFFYFLLTFFFFIYPVIFTEIHASPDEASERLDLVFRMIAGPALYSEAPISLFASANLSDSPSDTFLHPLQRCL